MIIKSWRNGFENNDALLLMKVKLSMKRSIKYRMKNMLTLENYAHVDSLEHYMAITFLIVPLQMKSNYSFILSCNIKFINSNIYFLFSFVFMPYCFCLNKSWTTFSSYLPFCCCFDATTGMRSNVSACLFTSRHIENIRFFWCNDSIFDKARCDICLRVS